uniref:Phlebovirus_G2 domain-containing protein n=1 Tax=Globodera pallida TaxID=36090 RepID=A0A183CLY7_GLOPA
MTLSTTKLLIIDALLRRHCFQNKYWKKHANMPAAQCPCQWTKCIKTEAFKASRCCKEGYEYKCCVDPEQSIKIGQKEYDRTNPGTARKGSEDLQNETSRAFVALLTSTKAGWALSISAVKRNCAQTK